MHKIWLKEKIGNPGLLTGRKREFDYYLKWIEGIKKEISMSQALLSRRKTGKTAILQRIYNLIFEKNDQVIPFYFEIQEADQWLGSLAEDFFLAFIYQYMAFKSRDREYLSVRIRTLEDALELSDREGFDCLIDPIKGMMIRRREESAEAMWDIARNFPRGIVDATNEKVVQIIDEFQFLNRYIFRDKFCQYRFENLAGTYLGTAEYKNAPLLVSGSWVGWLTRDILKLLPGRFQFHYLENIPKDEAIEMILKYSHMEDIPVTEATAPVISGITEGNPFYISTLFRSKYPGKDFKKEHGVRETLEFETLNKEGSIRGTWMEYVHYALDESNDVNAKQIVLYLSKHRERAVSRAEIKEALNLEMSDSELEKKLKILVMADIIEQNVSLFYYQGVRDNIFDKVFRGAYADEIEDFNTKEITNEYKLLFKKLKENYKSLRGEYSHFKGKFAEYRIIDNLMRRAHRNQRLFKGMMDNLPADFAFAEYESVWSYTASPVHKRDLQVDILARAKKDAYSLIGEVKNRKGKFSVKESEIFIKKSDELMDLEKIDKSLRFVFSVNGFNKNTLEYLKKNNIAWAYDPRWISDQEKL